MNFADHSEFERFLKARQLEGYQMCQPPGTKYVQNGTVAVRHYVCVTEGESRSNLPAKRPVCKLGNGACKASFVVRYSVDEGKKPVETLSLLKLKWSTAMAPFSRPKTSRQAYENIFSRSFDAG